jgi:hypothetical protein
MSHNHTPQTEHLGPTSANTNFQNILVEVAFAGSSAPAPSTNTSKFLICHTTGSGYNAGEVYFDTGTVLTLISISRGQPIQTAIAIGGSLNLIINAIYVAHTITAPYTWTLQGLATDVAGTARPPTTHASSHSTGQPDAIAITNIGGDAAGTARPPTTHASSHSTGQPDAIAIANIGGDAAGTARPPTSHASSHSTGQPDAIAIANIGGDAAGTARPPTAHASSHSAAQSDAISHNNLASPDGGTTGQYYHLTSAEHTVATRNASNAQSGLLSSFSSSTPTADSVSGAAGSNATASPSDHSHPYSTVIAALVPPASSITVGAGKAHAMIAEALTAAQGRVYPSAVTIDVDAGTYIENLTIANQPFADRITIKGDTRTNAGKHFATSGNITQVSGTHWKITCTGTMPVDYGSGDYIMVGGTTTAGNTGRFALVSPYIDGQDVHITIPSGAAAEAVLSETRVTFCPNRIINGSAATAVTVYCNSLVTISGFTIINSDTGIYCLNGGRVAPQRISCYGLSARGFYAIAGGNIYCDSNCATVSCDIGFYAVNFGYVSAGSTYSSNNIHQGYYAGTFGILISSSAVTTKNVTGFEADYGGNLRCDSAYTSYNSSNGVYASWGGKIHASSCHATHNTTYGYYALHGTSYINATSTNANNSANGTDYLPGTTDVVTTGAYITWT